MSKSEMTPSRRGRMATMLAGVRPTISLASAPMASDRLRLLVDGHHRRLVDDDAFAAHLTRVLAVPRSMPMSRENSPRRALSGLNTGKTPAGQYGAGRSLGVPPDAGAIIAQWIGHQHIISPTRDRRTRPSGAPWTAASADHRGVARRYAKRPARSSPARTRSGKSQPMESTP